MADHTDDAHERAMNFFIESLRRFRAGESLENVVERSSSIDVVRRRANLVD